LKQSLKTHGRKSKKKKLKHVVALQPKENKNNAWKQLLTC